jgi:regulator of sirC expression with transglutaminase-like and TPR domain
VPTPFADSPEFARLLGGAPDADLTRLALEIARDAYPDLDPDRYLRAIDLLAARARDRCPAGARPRYVLGQINWVLFVEDGFKGNDEDYYDPRNSYLNAVIDRRTGIPISLSALYLAIADRIGLPMAGVNFPGHFIIRTTDEPIFVDPFSEGTVMDASGCERLIAERLGRPIPLDEAALAPCSTAVVVARMLRNLKAIYLGQSDFASALPVLRRLVALSPDNPDERRDLGLACLGAGSTGEAIGHLDAYLDARPDAGDAEEVRARLRLAWREVGRWN